ncbi:DHA2 family efflux MFS transporter permease subunit [Cohnella lubricantis]|uniref:DHA2 family efflux MFS transporter permease subunit n=1 Tax=Cohnella lubricantis TaxID=2163172 RepID=A0A841TAC2_9BACL|nr:DHA2 family efflux MFS transporter permease subunit [Cohnella lubricantis]MBB6676348.1 DHA2 family efflux MFS transporter permease subunit [Cohnella lubricantis]MBP2120282.1 EmrB/QacA subfamily drug resistance transporter [Cohnella lubricantis]
MATTKAAAQQSSKEKLDPRIVKISLILVIGALAPLLDSTMVNVAVDTLTADFESAVSAIQWVITGYVLAMGLAVPISGWAVRRLGGKQVYLFSLVAFLTGSILCSLSWDAGSLIAFRIVQGAGAGLLVPTMQTVLVQTAGRQNLGRVMAIIGIPALLGPILGPVLGGLIVDGLSWRWIFYVNIPITAVALLLAWRGIPKQEAAGGKQPLDIVGLALLSPAFALLIYGISEVSGYGGLGHREVVIPLAVGLALMAAYIVHALRTARMPMLDIRLFRSRPFLASNVTLFLSGMVMNGGLLLIPLYYQQVRGESVLDTGLLLIPQGIGMLLTRSWIGRLTERTGARFIVIISLAFTVAGTLPFAFADAGTGHLLLAAGQLVRGAASNGLLIPIMVTAYEGLRQDQVPHASVSTRIFQTIGGAFGSAVLAAVIDHELSGRAAVGVGELADAYQTAFWWSIGFSVVSLLPALMLAARRREPGD